MKKRILLSHFIITAIIIFIISIYDFKDNGYWLIFLFSLVLYLLSGYFSTYKKSSWWNYFIVSIIGIVIWVFCFISSLHDLNYTGQSGNICFLYQLYIMVTSPLNFIDSIQDFLNGNIERQLFTDLLRLIFLSILQFVGGIIKTKKLDYIKSKKLPL